MRRLVLAAASALLLGAGLPAAAQRTMESQFMAEAVADWCGGAPAAHVRFGRYLSSSCWTAGVGAMSFTHSLSSGDTLEYIDVVAEGDWAYRLLSTRSRMLSLYGGGGVFLGYEAYDPWRRLPETIDPGLGKGTFVYGVRASLCSELFVSRRLALVLGASVPLTFSSSVDWFHWELSAGFRLDI